MAWQKHYLSCIAGWALTSTQEEMKEGRAVCLEEVLAMWWRTICHQQSSLNWALSCTTHSMRTSPRLKWERWAEPGRDMIKNMHETKCKSFTLLLWYWAQKSDCTGQITSLQTLDSPFTVSFCSQVTKHTLIGAGVSRGGEGHAEGLPLSHDTINDHDSGSSKNKDCFSIPPLLPGEWWTQGKGVVLWY